MCEKNIENNLIEELEKLGYERVNIKNIDDLENNFKEQIEYINDINFEGNEFSNLLTQITGSNNIYENSKILRDKVTITRLDTTKRNISLLFSEKWCKNKFQVANQITIDMNNQKKARYDVTLLINGIPLVQIELKNPKASIEKAFQDIIDYKSTYNTSLFRFLQIFIISNNHNTQYFVNNDNKYFRNKEAFKNTQIFKWSSDINETLNRLIKDFTPNFLTRKHIFKVIFEYIVLIETEQTLRVLRPYQIYAVEKIINAVLMKNEEKKSGYIWHTTGSGKTLTSFKTSILLKKIDEIDKVLFVVDRKDLDKQTIDEFNKFQEGCVDRTESSKVLIEKLTNSNYDNKIIVTTIQKINNVLKREKINKKIREKKVIFIFDECHRSVFGECFKKIKASFKDIKLFGFTGTPIFDENANANNKEITEKGEAEILNTKSLFGEELHKYTIGDAIENNTVLGFKVDHYSSAHSFVKKEDIVKFIFDKHERQTFNKKFNAIFTVSSIDDAIKYYSIFKSKNEQIKDDSKRLNVTSIFSPPNNKIFQDDLEEEKKEYEKNPEKITLKKDALNKIIKEYNAKYNTTFNINKFDEFYNDVSQRVKKHNEYNTLRERGKTIDILIVVEMLLTGFDSAYTNTLYVDKNLKNHGLIQAFSRTNRKVDATKPHGNIVCFKDLKENIHEAIRIFAGDNNSDGKKFLVENFEEIKNNLASAWVNLEDFFKDKGLEFSPSSVAKLKIDLEKIEFLNLFTEVLKKFIQIKQYIDYNDDAISNDLKVEKIEDLIEEFKAQYLPLNDEINRKVKKQDDDAINEKLEPSKLELFESYLIDYTYICELLNNKLKERKNEHNITDDNYEREQILKILRADKQFFKIVDIAEDFLKQKEDKDFAHFLENREKENFNKMVDEFNLNIQVFKDIKKYYINTNLINEDIIDESFKENYGLMTRYSKKEKIIEKLEKHFDKFWKGKIL